MHVRIALCVDKGKIKNQVKNMMKRGLVFQIT